MSTADHPTKPQLQPRWIHAIVAGFNIIANNIYLILLPMGLDLVLWLGPRVRVKALMEPMIRVFIQGLGTGNANATALGESALELWQAVLTEFNLLSLLRTFPVGVPSLFANKSVLSTPLGQPAIIELSSAFQALLVWTCIVAFGLLLGTFFYSLVARKALAGEKSVSIWNGFLQTFVLSAAMILFLVVLSIPLTLVLSVVTLISIGLGQVMLILVGVVLVWMLMPLVFSAHGIYVFRQSAMISILTSVRMVRFLLPGVSMFIFTSALLLLGLDLIWTMPDQSSWMVLIGIAGHAFIASAILAASFVYFRNGVIFMQETLRRWANQQATPAQTAQ